MGQPFGSGYELDEQVRPGRLGHLWRAHDLGGRACAITILDHELSSRVGAELSHRFWAIRPQWLALGGTSAVVKDIVIDGPRRGLVTDWIDGQPLDEALDQYGAMPADDLRQLGAEIADALATIHDAGLTHGNLTTSNVVVDFSGDRPVPRLTGLSDAALLGVHNRSFAAPEVTDGRAVTAASDLYSLGMVLASMNTGRLPRSGEDDAEPTTLATGEARQPLPDAVSRLITRLTDQNPARRGSARAVAEALRVGSLGPIEESDATMVLPQIPAAPQTPWPPQTARLPRTTVPAASAPQENPAPVRPKHRRVTIPWLLLLLLPLIGYAGWLGVQQLLKPVGDEAIPLPQQTPTPVKPSASAKPAASVAPSSTPAPEPSASAKPTFPRGVASCGTRVGVVASTTSCEFAAVVDKAAQPIMASGKRTFTVSATSPLTKQTYTMSCKPSGDFVVCTGGDEAAVYLRI